jgi:serine phosphatase RsbU (regulator of sigma subunit)
LVQLAEQVGLALDRAYLLAHHRGIAAALQEGLQPQRLPDIAGIRAAAVYLPAGDVDAGGDWYDLFETGDGAVMAVIGDVVGHGIPAVASMARLRHVLSGYLFAGHGPGESLRLTNQVLFGMIDEHQRMATVAIAMIDRDRRRVVTARAGHPPMIVRSGDEVHLTDVQVQPPLGVTAGTEWVPEEILDLKPDTLLVLYTDGWIDFPGSDPMGRIEAMCRVVAAAEADPDAVLAALEERFTDHRRRDDAAALAVVVL